MTLPWVNDPTPSDYRDAATEEWADALATIATHYPDAHLTEVVPGAAHFYRIEAEHEDYLLEFADSETGHLTRNEPPVVWECLVYDTDGALVSSETRAELAVLVDATRAWCLARVEADRVAQADDPDRDHDLRRA